MLNLFTSHQHHDHSCLFFQHLHRRRFGTLQSHHVQKHAQARRLGPHGPALVQPNVAVSLAAEHAPVNTRQFVQAQQNKQYNVEQLRHVIVYGVNGRRTLHLHVTATFNLAVI